MFCRTFYCSFPFPPSRDKRREAFYLRTKQCHESASRTADLLIMTTVKTALDHTADHVSRSKYIHAFCYALCAYLQQKSARWPSGNELDSGTVGLGSNPGSVKLESCQRLATAATFLRKELCCPGAMSRQWAPQTRFTLRRNTARVIKI